jgi:adenylate cyclase
MGEDEGAVQNALRRAHQAVLSVLERSGARPLPAPSYAILALGPNAGRVVAAAADAQRALADLNQTFQPDIKVHYQIGIAEGELESGTAGPAGPAFDRAGTLAFAASADSIRTTENVQMHFGAERGLPVRKVEPGTYELGGTAAAHPAGFPVQLRALDPPRPNRPSIVILPFQSTGDDRDESEVFAEGLRLDVQNTLTKMSGIFLIAAGSAGAMRGWSGTDAARRAGVRYALEGTVQRSADRLRVSVQLTDAVAGTVPWSERYDRLLDHGFGLQDEITASIVTALDVKLASGEQARVWHKCLADPGARECFYRGVQAFMRMNRDSIASARTFFHRLVEIAPDSPFGPTWLALCFWFESARGWATDPMEAREQAGLWAERAVQMEDADGQAHTVLGNVRLLQRRFDEALAIAREALEIRPGCANANGFLANVLLYCGKTQQAAVHARRAIRFMPVYPPWFVEILATSYRDGGNLDFSIISAREVLRILPSSIPARLVLASALVRNGWLSEAHRFAGEARELDGKLTLSRWASSQPYSAPEALAAVREDLARAGLPQ